MRICRLTLLSIVITVFAGSASAGDYAVDPSFNPVFGYTSELSEPIGDVVPLPDGKVLVGGGFISVNGTPAKYVARLNPDGSVDTTFNSALSPISGLFPAVETITVLPDGKLWVTGRFQVGSEFASYAKLNADGSIDSSMNNYALISSKRMVPLPDGKFIVCGGRQVNGEPYWLSHRLNADGSVDPSYRVTFSKGNCGQIERLPDGKILMAGWFHDDNNFNFEPVQRFNSDGSHDPTFSLQTSRAGGSSFTLLPDGKFIFPYQANGGHFVKRFNSDGSVDLTFTTGCDASSILTMADGNLLMNRCRKYPNGLLYRFARVSSTGAMDPSLDWIDFNFDVYGFRSVTGGSYYAFGSFNMVDGQARACVARLMPYQKPIKAKYDFDGDNKTDVAVFRPTDRVWYLNRSTAGPSYQQWGLMTDKLVAADHDFDGKTDIAVYRDGLWYSYGSTHGYNWFHHGATPDKPLVAHFDNDGKNDWAVRAINGGAVSWSVKRGGTPILSSVDTMTVDGELPDDKPVIGDFDGDHRDELGYFRNGVWATRDFGTGAPTATFRWGSAGDIPVPADYDGDGHTDYAVFRPSTGVWWINRSSQGIFVIAFGISTDIPVPGDYDGDGKTDVAIFRDGQWWQYRTTGSVFVDNWGAAGDIPIPAQDR